MNIDPAAEGHDKTEDVMFWMGVRIDESMDKALLIEIIHWLGRDIKSMREGHERDVNFWQLLAKRRAA